MERYKIVDTLENKEIITDKLAIKCGIFKGHRLMHSISDEKRFKIYVDKEHSWEYISYEGFMNRLLVS